MTNLKQRGLQAAWRFRHELFFVSTFAAAVLFFELRGDVEDFEVKSALDELFPKPGFMVEDCHWISRHWPFVGCNVLIADRSEASRVMSSWMRLGWSIPKGNGKGWSMYCKGGLSMAMVEVPGGFHVVLSRADPALAMHMSDVESWCHRRARSVSQ